MMGTTHIKMVDVDKCIVCGKHIGLGNDPALCSDNGCYVIYKYETNFNRWAKNENIFVQSKGA